MIDERDRQMMSISVPVLDYLEMREDLDRLENAVVRLERVAEVLVELYFSERTKSWEMILKEMLKKEESKKGNYYGHRTG